MYFINMIIKCNLLSILMPKSTSYFTTLYAAVFDTYALFITITFYQITLAT